MTINDLIKRAHATAKSKGWWDEPRSVLECLVLVHSEVSEAVEEYRKPTTQVAFTVELADVLIRIADLCGVGLDSRLVLGLHQDAGGFGLRPLPISL